MLSIQLPVWASLPSFCDFVEYGRVWWKVEDRAGSVEAGKAKQEALASNNVPAEAPVAVA